MAGLFENALILPPGCTQHHPRPQKQEAEEGAAEFSNENRFVSRRSAPGAKHQSASRRRRGPLASPPRFLDDDLLGRQPGSVPSLVRSCRIWGNEFRFFGAIAVGIPSAAQLSFCLSCRQRPPQAGAKIGGQLPWSSIKLPSTRSTTKVPSRSRAVSSSKPGSAADDVFALFCTRPPPPSPRHKLLRANNALLFPASALNLRPVTAGAASPLDWPTASRARSGGRRPAGRGAGARARGPTKERARKDHRKAHGFFS